MPRPNNSCQMRFTATRAVSGLSRRDQPARQRRGGRACAGGQRRQHGERAGLHFGAVFAPVALDVDVRLRAACRSRAAPARADRRQLGVKLVQLGRAVRRTSDRVAVLLADRGCRRSSRKYIESSRSAAPRCASRGSRNSTLRRVVHGVRELAVGEIPIVVLAGVQRGVAQLRLPSRPGSRESCTRPAAACALAVVRRARGAGRARARRAGARRCSPLPAVLKKAMSW